MPSNFTEDKILLLIRDRTPENLYLEYKSIKALQKNDSSTRTEISKDISSFANSAGGDIIYGINESKKGLPPEIDGTLAIDEKREWFEQIVNSNIQPRITGINVYSVIISSQLDKAVLVVNIPQSYTAHQANDQRYWCRYGSEKQAMEDYQVRQTINRIREPVIEFVLKTNAIELPEVVQLNNQKTLEMHLENNGVFSVSSWQFYFYFPRDILFMHQGSWEEDSYSSQQIRNTIKWKINEKDTKSMVIHPGQRYILSNSYDRNRFVLAIQNEYHLWDRTLYGYYAIYAENMSPKYGSIEYMFYTGELMIITKRLDKLPFSF